MVFLAYFFPDRAFSQVDGEEGGFPGEGGLCLLDLNIDALLDLGLNVLGDFLAFLDERRLVFLAPRPGLFDEPVRLGLKVFDLALHFGQGATARSRACRDSSMDFAISAVRDLKASRIGFLRK